MKTLLLSLVILCTHKVHTEKPCLPPGGLKSLEHCCKVPVLFEDSSIFACEKMCLKSGASVPVDCIQQCLIMNNGIVRENEVNTTALEVMYSRFGLAPKVWENITREGLHKCTLDIKSGKNFKEVLEKFEDCMNFHFEDNCVDFNESPECDSVEDFMETCMNIEPDCNEWPQWIVRLPEQCCPNTPVLFPQDKMQAANSHCESLNIPSNLGKLECVATYLLKATEIYVDKKWNFQTAKNMLNKNDPKDGKWKEAIESTIHTCESQVQEDEKAKLSEGNVHFWFYECIKGSLADFCIEYDVKKKPCRRIKKYKEKCPKSVPPRRSYMNNGRMD